MQGSGPAGARVSPALVVAGGAGSVAKRRALASPLEQVALRRSIYPPTSCLSHAGISLLPYSPENSLDFNEAVFRDLLKNGGIILKRNKRQRP